MALESTRAQTWTATTNRGRQTQIVGKTHTTWTETPKRGKSPQNVDLPPKTWADDSSIESGRAGCCHGMLSLHAIDFIRTSIPEEYDFPIGIGAFPSEIRQTALGSVLPSNEQFP